jgi:hypothetical protein
MHFHKHHPDIIALGSHITELGWLLPEAGSTRVEQRKLWAVLLWQVCWQQQEAICWAGESSSLRLCIFYPRQPVSSEREQNKEMSRVLIGNLISETGSALSLWFSRHQRSLKLQIQNKTLTPLVMLFLPQAGFIVEKGSYGIENCGRNLLH